MGTCRFFKFFGLLSESAPHFFCKRVFKIYGIKLHKLQDMNYKDNISPLIEVSVRLKPSQRVDINRWKYHLNGEEREATLPNVVWSAVTLMSACKSFNQNEVEYFRIESSKI